MTDNDPDSRGPNRLIEIVPGGDYGYQSLYGGSGIHPYLAWNGELPGTLPFAAPLGEAPCALIDAKFTHFGEAYTQTVLVNIWEENNIVRIPLTEEGSTVKGTPEVLVQGDSTFHPVGFATNSKGELFISDWVIRQYPNHGQGKIWRLKRKDGGNMGPLKLATPIHQELPSMTEEEMLAVLQTSEDLFVQSMLRRMLALQAPPEVLKGMVQSTSDLIKMQGILVYSEAKEMMPAPLLRSLLKDSNPNIRQTALRYAGQQTRTEVGPAIERMLGKGLITAEMFETYLATLRHVQPTFAEPFQERKEERSRALPRVLPEGYLTEVVQDASLSEAIRALAVPYMKVKKEDQVWLGKQLTQASDASFQVGLIKVLKQLPQKHPTNSNC
ncbi:MAG: HEAT repeat domain-containing protein [Bacteroidota bacterium]